MPNYFGILFGQNGAYGWSEVYPIQTTSYSAAQDALQTVMQARLGILGLDSQINATRISDSDVKGDAAILPGSFPLPGTFGVAGLDTVYNCQLSLRLKETAGFLHRASRWIRAIPRSQVGPSGNYVPTTPFSVALSNYLSALETQVNISHRISSAAAPPFYQFFPITEIDTMGIESRKCGRPSGLPRGRELVG